MLWHWLLLLWYPSAIVVAVTNNIISLHHYNDYEEEEEASLHHGLDHRVGTYQAPLQAHDTPGTFPPTTSSALDGTFVPHLPLTPSCPASCTSDLGLGQAWREEELLE